MEHGMPKKMAAKLLSIGIGFITSFLITKIVVGKMGGEAYGFYQLANDFITYASIASVALNSMASRFITVVYYEKRIEETNQYFNSLLFANIILVAILLLPATFIVLKLESILSIPIELLSDVRLLFFLTMLNFLISILSSVFMLSTFVKNRIDIDSFLYMEACFFRIMLVTIIYYALPPKIWYLGVIYILSTIYLLARNMYYTKKLMPEVHIGNRKAYRAEKVKILVRSGIWNSFTKVGAILLNGMDLLIANLFVNAYAMGVISIAKTIPKYILAAMASVSAVFVPDLTIEYAKGNQREVIRKIRFAIKVNAFFSNVLEIAIMVLGVRLFQLWVPSEDAYLLQQLSVICIVAYVMLMPYEILYTVFTLTDKVKISSIYLTTEAVLTIVCVFVLLYIFPDQRMRMFIIVGVSGFFEMIRALLFLPIACGKYLSCPVKEIYMPLGRSIAAFMIGGGVTSIFNSFFGELKLIGFCLLSVIVVFSALMIQWLVLFTSFERKQLMEIVRKRHLV